MQWHEAPTPEEILSALKRVAAIKGSILRLKRNIQKQEDILKDKYPRKPELRRRELEVLYDELTELEVQEIDATQDVEFNAIRLKMYQTVSYKR